MITEHEHEEAFQGLPKGPEGGQGPAYTTLHPSCSGTRGSEDEEKIGNCESPIV